MELLTLTPSNINYLACPSKLFHLVQKRQYGGTKGTSPALRYGIGIHDVLARLYRQEDSHDLDRLDYYMRAAFARLPYKVESDRDLDMHRGETLVRLYMAQMDDAVDRIVGVERTGAETISSKGKALFRGWAQLDLMFVPAGDPTTLIVRDWRIGSAKSLEIFQIFLNLFVAKSIAPGFDRYILQVDSINSDTGVDRYSYSSKLLSGVVRMICRDVEAYLSEDAHVPIPGSECRHCGHAEKCIASRPAIDIEEADF